MNSFNEGREWVKQYLGTAFFSWTRKMWYSELLIGMFDRGEKIICAGERWGTRGGNAVACMSLSHSRPTSPISLTTRSHNYQSTPPVISAWPVHTQAWKTGGKMFWSSFSSFYCQFTVYGKTECVHNSRDNLGKDPYFYAGGVLRARGFDTFWSSSAANHLREYLNDIKGKYVYRLTYMFVLLCTSRDHKWRTHKGTWKLNNCHCSCSLRFCTRHIRPLMFCLRIVNETLAVNSTRYKLISLTSQNWKKLKAYPVLRRDPPSRQKIFLRRLIV